MFRIVVASLLFSSAFVANAGTLMGAREAEASVVVHNSNPLIHYHGRWDTSPGTWWASSGFILNVQGLSALSLTLGPHTTQPLTTLGVSINYGETQSVNVSAGTNVIHVPKSSIFKNTVVRIDVEGWQNNRMNLESISLNKGATLLPYVPSKLNFQFIGDSLSAGVGPGNQGQYLPEGVNQAWPYLTGEFFKAEHTVNAQPGAALTDILSYGNVHGVSYQYFRTEDTGYYYTTDHNYTTPWKFKRDQPPTHVVIHIGANDASQGVTADQFVQVYLQFIQKLRTLYPHQPIFVFTPWGWPSPDAPNSYYYPGSYEQIVVTRHSLGDKQVFLVNTTGWVDWDDVFPDNQHPTVAGHEKIAGEFETWLENWGLKPLKEWATSA